MRLFLLLFLTMLSAVTRSSGAAPLPPVEPRVEPLWPDGSPHNPVDGPRPTLEIYRPFAPARAISVTVVILPGGGYSLLSPFERLLAEYFRSLGYTAVVVNYRLKPHHYPAPLADAQRALRLVRRHAADWDIPAKRIALLGGSAGGHLASLVATQPDVYRDSEDTLAGAVSARPDRLILLYPVISAVAPYRHRCLENWFPAGATEGLREAASPELHVDRNTPPTILFHAADDTNVIPENSLAFARACWSAGVPAELHVFPRGGHGRAFAYDAEVSPRWRALLQQWLDAWAE